MKHLRSAFLVAAALWTIERSTQAVLLHIDQDVRLRAALLESQRSAMLDVECQPRQAGPTMLAELKERK